VDYVFEQQWKQTLQKVSEDFGDELDLQSIIFLIGVQELGQGFRTFKKDEKIDLMHIAICTLLEPYGFYRFTHRDNDGWPHFERLDDLPALDAQQQEVLMKKAIIQYFGKED